MLAIRLARLGATHQPSYRVVVSESTRTPRAACRENIGFYDPRVEPPRLEIKLDRADYWIKQGAKPSETVRSLLAKAKAAAAAPAEPK